MSSILQIQEIQLYITGEKNYRAQCHMQIGKYHQFPN